MICAMKVISVGFDMDAASASAAAASHAANTEQEETTTAATTEKDRSAAGRGETRGRAVRKTTVKSSVMGGTQAAKAGGGDSSPASGDDTPRRGTEADSTDDLAVMPGWFEFAGCGFYHFIMVIYLVLENLHIGLMSTVGTVWYTCGTVPNCQDTEGTIVSCV